MVVIPAGLDPVSSGDGRAGMEMRAGAGWRRLGPAAASGAGFVPWCGMGQWGWAARDAGSSWNANPNVSLALGLSHGGDTTWFLRTVGVESY